VHVGGLSKIAHSLDFIIRRRRTKRPSTFFTCNISPIFRVIVALEMPRIKSFEVSRQAEKCCSQRRIANEVLLYYASIIIFLSVCRPIDS